MQDEENDGLRSEVAQHPPGGWAPPAEPGGPTVAPPADGVARSQPQVTEDYKSLASRGFLASRWLLLNMAVTAAVLVLSVLHLRLLNAKVPDSEAILAGNDMIAAVSIAEIVIYLLGLVIFLVWFRRAYANAPALGLYRLRFGKGWAIGAWFVPILNLFRPKQIANDCWRAGDPDRPVGSPFGSDGQVSPLMHWWWGAWLLSGIVANFASRLPFETVDEDRTYTGAAIGSSALWLVASVLAILVVRRITARQEARAQRLREAAREGAPDTVPHSTG